MQNELLSTIPLFPSFKNIEWSDRLEVEVFTSMFPPYSDFNFTSMWSWNTNGKMMLSKLNGNLVVLFNDYISEKPFLSFIGKNNISETAEILIEYSQIKYQTGSLKLIPKDVTNICSNYELKFYADEDSNDYILSTSYLMSLNTLPSKDTTAQNCKRFLRVYPHFITKYLPLTEVNKDDLIKMFIKWAYDKNSNHHELNEFKAFERLIQNNETNNDLVLIYDCEKLIGLLTIEIVSKDYAICHFAKADSTYKGTYEALMWEAGKILSEKEIKYLNIEQDLGLPNLRFSKKKFKPTFFLNKLIIEKSLLK